MSVQVLEKLPEDFFNPLLALLAKKKVPKVSEAANRKNFPKGHRAVPYGYVWGRVTRTVALSAASRKNPDIYNELVRIGKIFCPFEFKAIYLNNNVVCPKHFDGHNVGDSLLISFGDYTGCNIVINDVKYDARHTPVIFNGALLEHYNTDDLVGNKYSLIYYN